MYTLVAIKYTTIKSFKLVLAIIISIILAFFIFQKNPTLITVSALVCGQLAFIIYFEDTKGIRRNALLSGLAISVFIALSAVLGKYTQYALYFTLIMVFLSFYLVRFHTFISPSALKTGTVNFFIYSSNVTYQSFPWYLLLVAGALGTVVLYVVVLYFFPEKTFLYTKNIPKNFTKTYTEYLFHLTSAITHRQKNKKYHTKKHTQFLKNYSHFVGTILNLKLPLIQKKEVLDKLTEQYSLHHMIMKKLYLVDTSLFHIISNHFGTPHLYHKLTDYFSLYQSFLKNGNRNNFNTLDSLYLEIYTIIQERYEKKKQKDLLHLLFALKTMTQFKENIYQNLIKESA